MMMQKRKDGTEITVIAGKYDEDHSYICEFINGYGLQAFIRTGTAPFCLRQEWQRLAKKEGCKTIYTRQMNLYTDFFQKELDTITVKPDTNDDLNLIMKQFARQLTDEKKFIKSW